MPATTRMDASATADDVAEVLKRDGYAIVEHLLSPAEAAQKRAELTRILAATPEGRNDFEGFKTRRIYALFAKTRAFDEPATHPLILGVLDRILGPATSSARPSASRSIPARRRRCCTRDDGIYPIAAPAPGGGAQHHVAARRLHGGERRDARRARQPSLGR